MNRNEAFNVILQSHDNFMPIWNEHIKYWENETPGITNDFSEYADYVLELIKTNNTKELEIALEIIELLIENGDENVQYGITIGFLEGITNSLLALEPKYSLLFTNKLKPKSKKFCEELDEFWGTTTPGIK